SGACAPAPPASRSGHGHEAWTWSRTSWVSAPLIQSTMPLQKDPAPTSDGMRSEPSKRATAVSSWSSSMARRRTSEDASAGATAAGGCGRGAAGTVGRGHPADLDAGVGPFAGGHEGLDGLGGRVVVEGADELAGDEQRALVGGEAGQVEGEDVALRADLGALGPLRLVEGGLAVQEAVALEDRQAAVVEGRRRDGAGVADAAVDVVVVLEDGAGGLDGLDDDRVVERDLVDHPPVVDVGAGGAQDDVLDPVGGGPPGGAAGLDAGAPGLDGVGAVVGGDLLGQRHELVPRLGDLVVVLREGAGRVPDEGLHAGHERGGVELAVHRAVGLPVLAPALVDLGLHGVRR